jgi:hypothetical protein|tara:strand:- start:4280 stop:4414 length:135 start_codon:yes stop_codon:yes gene_type:complete
MVQHHKYSITDLENLIPFELDVYMNMLLKHLDEQKQENQKESLL